MRSASVSTWPNIIVAEPRPPSSCHTRQTFSQSSVMHLAAGDLLPDAIDEDFRPAAGQAAQPRRLAAARALSRSGSLKTLVKC